MHVPAPPEGERGRAIVTVRPASAADIPFIMATERGPGFERLVGRSEEAQHRAEIDHPGGAYLIGQSDGVPTGFAILRGFDDPFGNIYLKRAATAGGTSSSTFPPNDATSLTPLDETGIRRLQAMKTGAILAFSVEAGAILARADDAVRRDLLAFGRALGGAFQVADDILDREAPSETLGKRTGKDRERGKATLVDLLGIEGARLECDRLLDAAVQALANFGAEADPLRAAARFAVERKA